MSGGDAVVVVSAAFLSGCAVDGVSVDGTSLDGTIEEGGDGAGLAVVVGGALLLVVDVTLVVVGGSGFFEVELPFPVSSFPPPIPCTVVSLPALPFPELPFPEFPFPEFPFPGRTATAGAATRTNPHNSAAMAATIPTFGRASPPVLQATIPPAASARSRPGRLLPRTFRIESENSWRRRVPPTWPLSLAWREHRDRGRADDEGDNRHR
jgi:hypothetical protein